MIDGSYIVDVIDPTRKKLLCRLLKHPHENIVTPSGPYLFLTSVHPFVLPRFHDRYLEKFSGFHLDIDLPYHQVFPPVYELLTSTFPNRKLIFVKTGTGNLYAFVPVRDFFDKGLFCHYTLKLCNTLYYLFGIRADVKTSISVFSRRFLLGVRSHGKKLTPKIEEITKGRILSFSELRSNFFRLDTILSYLIAKEHFAFPTWQKVICRLVPVAKFLRVPPRIFGQIVSDLLYSKKGRKKEKTFCEVIDAYFRYDAAKDTRSKDATLFFCKSHILHGEKSAERLFARCLLGENRPYFYRRLRKLESQGLITIRKRNGRLRLQPKMIGGCLWD